MKRLIEWLYFKFVYNYENENKEYLKLKKEFEDLVNRKSCGCGKGDACSGCPPTLNN